MTQIPSVLVIDDEASSYKPLEEAFAEEIKSKPYNLDFAQSGMQGLKRARQIAERDNSLLIIDLILPDLPGDRLIEILNEEKTENINFKAVVISAHETLEKLQQLKDKYDWILDYFPKPLGRIQVQSLVEILFGKPLAQKFDYEQLDPTMADLIRQQTGEINLWLTQTAVGAIEVGEKIIKIKEEYLSHGQFQAWVRSELKCHQNTVGNLISAARVFGHRKEEIASSGLVTSVIYQLSKNVIAPEMREKVIREAKSGQVFSVKDVKNLQKEYKPKQKTISQSPESGADRQSNSSTSLERATTISPPQKITQKQEIIKVLPQKIEVPKAEPPKFWQLNQHLLFCGYPNSPDFIAKLPNQVDLTIAFSRSPDWSKESIIPVPTNSTTIFQSNFPDYDPLALKAMTRHAIEMSRLALELYTEDEKEDPNSVVISFLPDFDILQLVDSLGCRCFIAEPDLQKCQQLLSMSKF